MEKLLVHCTKRSITILVMLVLAVSLAADLAYAADPLLEKLTQKGVLSQDEAAQIGNAAEKQEAKLPKGLDGVSIGALAYIDYSAGNTLSNGRESSYNKFAVTRGYINITKQITPCFSARITPDIFQETGASGTSDSGSWLLRFKYYYAQFNWPELGFLTNNKTEFGMGHMAWLDFQEHVNPYRCQGTMFQERFGNFNSSDMGVGLMGYLGGEIDEAYQKNVSKYYAGRYGSYHLGLYNGSGYHATENNDNKVLEYRLTVRPLPELMPGLQLTYFGVTGKGDSSTYTGSNAPDWRVNTGFLSYEAEMFTVTAEVISNKGNQGGTWVKTGTNDSKSVKGYSFFGSVRVPRLESLRVHARYDSFDPDTDVADDKAQLIITGLSYDVYKNNMVMLNYERFTYERNNDKVGGVANADDAEQRVQLVYQISF